MHAHDPKPRSESERRDRGRSTAQRQSAPPDPRSLAALQRSIGNAAVVRLLGRQLEPEEAPVQRSTVHQVLRSPGRPLADCVRTEMEARLGAGFTSVRLHDGPAAARSAAEMSARAYTSGEHVVIGHDGGDKHTLAHELAHVIQQRSGPVSGTDLGDGLSVSDPGDRFERAAEANAVRALSGPVPEAAVQRAAAHSPSAAPVLPVQRAFTGASYVNYGGVNGNGVGTTMHAELWPGQLGKGSAPQEQPSWWPKGGATGTWFQNFMVQGHLLNHNVGGPGVMKNMTPITASANSEHHAKVEKKFKDEVLNKGHVVEYFVEADYSTHPAAKDFKTGDANVDADIDANYAAKLAGKIHAEYTIYDTKGKELGDDAWLIENNRLKN
ncbi:eCIS core domain-containing protein [Streptomyces halstedii]|uniref:eCIS core domain-containing protein n=1 Tax=Streptomyces halstedii TaxID=1944 RepID=UPI0036585558